MCRLWYEGEDSEHNTRSFAFGIREETRSERESVVSNF